MGDLGGSGHRQLSTHRTHKAATMYHPKVVHRGGVGWEKVVGWEMAFGSGRQRTGRLQGEGRGGNRKVVRSTGDMHSGMDQA